MPLITFRLATRADLPTLHDWLTRPHVAEWWAPTPTLPELEDEYGPAIDGADTTLPYIAYFGDAPLGFIQSYVALGSGDGWWEDVTDPGLRGIDQFLADGERLGQGLGTLMVRAFVATLFDDPAVTAVQTDPDPRNARAIRCYEKAGFVRIAEIDTPDGRALLMRRDR
jgi:RimJ/RimL family protein N-acetyltransferase